MRDLTLLFVSRGVRLFAYGFLSVVLVLYLKELGLSDGRVGLLLTLTLLGDTALTIWLTTLADRCGRRRMLLVGAGLMVLAGLVFAATRNPLWLLAAATIGVISPSGSEVGPFLAIEQAALTQLLKPERRTLLFAWYNLLGSFTTACGALVAGEACAAMQAGGAAGAAIYRPVVQSYGLLGLVLGACVLGLSAAVELPAHEKPHASTGRSGLGQSRKLVAKLSVLFAMDAFGGGFVVQAVLAYWFTIRFGVEPATLGKLFFAANLLAGASSLLAVWLARRIGLINTMVFTHLPSNLLLMLVPLMPTFPLAAGLLFIRYSLSQMDVPTRQSYLMAVVSPAERSAAAGWTMMARSLGAACSPALAMQLIALPHGIAWPLYLSGVIKIAYDLLLYREFVHVKPPEERKV